MTFLTILEVMEILCGFILVLEEKTGKEIPESLRLEFIEKFSANNFADRGCVADLPLLRTLLAIYQNSGEPSLWKVMKSCFSSMCKFGSFRNPFATITNLSELYFRFRRFILLVQTKKNGFCELWQQHKHPKTMEISEV